MILAVASLLSGLGAIGAAIGAMVTARATRQQVQAFTLALKAETMLKLLEKFDGDNYVAIRKTAAMACLLHLDDKEPGATVEPILDILDDAAFLVEKGALDAEMMHHAFYHWVRLYWQACAKQITSRREDEPAMWNNLSAIYPRLNDIERAAKPSTYREQLSQSEIKEYLEDELS
jgi:hypothetical protein